jgi:hypothetical protein
MRFLLFLLLAVIAIFSIGCEKQPLPNEPHPAADEKHGQAKHENAVVAKEGEHASSADAAKSGEAPKFFPEKK